MSRDCQAGATALLLVSVGCAAADPAPREPTWYDVEPILRANCFHCHGSEWEEVGRCYATKPSRFDVYDPMDAGYRDLGVATDGILDMGAKSAATRILQFSLSTAETSRMPPPPATRLSDREIEILELWKAAHAPRGTRADNHRPRAQLLVAPEMIGPDLVVSLVVSDEDHDQVLGKVTLNGTIEKPLKRAGAHIITFEGSPRAQTLTVTLFDGQDRFGGPPDAPAPNSVKRWNQSPDAGARVDCQ